MLYLNPDVKYQKTQEHFTHAKIWINDPIVAIQNVCKATLPSSEQKLPLKTIMPLLDEKDFNSGQGVKNMFFFFSQRNAMHLLYSGNK